jgi:hypothetical protein
VYHACSEFMELEVYALLCSSLRCLKVLDPRDGRHDEYVSNPMGPEYMTYQYIKDRKFSGVRDSLQVCESHFTWSLCCYVATLAVSTLVFF